MTGKIIEDRVIVESLGFFQQMGVLAGTDELMRRFAGGRMRVGMAKFLVTGSGFCNGNQYNGLTSLADHWVLLGFMISKCDLQAVFPNNRKRVKIMWLKQCAVGGQNQPSPAGRI